MNKQKTQCGIGTKADIDQWNRIKFRSKMLNLRSNNFWQGCQDYLVGKGQSFQQMVLENWISTAKI